VLTPILSGRAQVLRAAAVCAVALSAAPAFAQAPPPGASALSFGDPEAQRSSLYRDGVALANAGRWEEAVAKFREVIAIRSAPPALFTLGQAEEHLNHFVSAKRVYAKAQTDALAAGGHDVAEAAQKALAAVEAHIARLTIRVASPSEGVTATIDGAAAAVGEPLEVDPGEHQVSVRAPNRPPYDARVHLTDGERQEMNATLRVEAAPAAGVGPVGETSTRFPVGPVVLGGVGVAAVILGLVVRQTAQSSFDAADTGCPPSGCSTQSAVADGNAARGRIIAGEATLIVGIAAAAGAATWWLVTPKRSEAGTSVGLQLVPTPSGLRAGASVRF
jgi:hypothetical protein